MPTSNARRISPATPRVVWQRPIPPAIRAMCPFPRYDYADLVVASTSPEAERSPDEWIAAGLAGISPRWRRMIPLVQRSVLGLRLHLRPSPEHLLGWKIAERRDDLVRIEAGGWLIAANVILKADPERPSFATFVRYNHALAKFIWPPVSLLHRRVALALVRAAVTPTAADRA